MYMFGASDAAKLSYEGVGARRNRGTATRRSKPKKGQVYASTTSFNDSCAATLCWCLVAILCLDDDEAQCGMISISEPQSDDVIACSGCLRAAESWCSATHESPA